MEKNVIAEISNIKCTFGNSFYNQFIEKKFMVKICNDDNFNNKSDKELYLKQYLLDNIRFLNFNNEFNIPVKNCNI